MPCLLTLIGRQVFFAGKKWEFGLQEAVQIGDGKSHFRIGIGEFFEVAVAPGDGTGVDACFVSCKDIQFGVADHHALFGGNP